MRYHRVRSRWGGPFGGTSLGGAVGQAHRHRLPNSGNLLDIAVFFSSDVMFSFRRQRSKKTTVKIRLLSSFRLTQARTRERENEKKKIEKKEERKYQPRFEYLDSPCPVPRASHDRIQKVRTTISRDSKNPDDSGNFRVDFSPDRTRIPFLFLLFFLFPRRLCVFKRSPRCGKPTAPRLRKTGTPVDARHPLPPSPPTKKGPLGPRRFPGSRADKSPFSHIPGPARGRREGSSYRQTTSRRRRMLERHKS